MEKENKKTIEIPFGAKDSELYKFKYTIPEGYEAEIKGGKVILKKKESEDERIRKILIHIVKGACNKYGIKYMGDEIGQEKLLAYLEKQKEQKPAEWSEEEKRAIDRACVALRAYSNGELPEFLPSELLSYAERLQSLRPQQHWKPSEEQMEYLAKGIIILGEEGNCKTSAVLNELRNDLQKLL